MNLHVYPNVDALIHAYASYIIQCIEEAISMRGICNLVLSGGNSPKPVFHLLTESPYRDGVNWERVYFFFGDERYVPADNERNNARMAETLLLHPLEIRASQIFAIDTSLAPDQSARQYELRIREHFQDQPIEFDLILLGLGDNAHTASLFPHSDILAQQFPTVVSIYVPEEKEFRITMSAPLINLARHVSFLAFGDTKASAVFQVIKGARNPERYPAQLIHPASGSMDWFLDSTAATRL